MKKIVVVPTPSVTEVLKYLQKWETLNNYVWQERSLKKLFNKTYPLNNDMDDILIKVCSLNDFYSTNIFSPFSVAEHIQKLKIDDELRNGDLTLVNKISCINIKGKEKNFYSFATKYCSHHFPLIYPIYDSFVEKLLNHFKKIDRFYNFEKNDLKIYTKFNDILLSFKKFYGLEKFSVKEIDKYLWQVGKEYFPKTYGKT